MKKAIGWIMIMVIVLVPILVNAQIGIPPMHHPKDEAAKDAKEDANHVVWFGTGLLLGPIGLGIAYAVQPSPPPADRLVGKSEVYVKEYVTTYRNIKKKLQQNDALAGCIPGTLVWVTIIFLAAGSNEDE
jgi:hypothetical protein